jgi:phosphohistidine phosphatase SixA
MKRRLIVLRHAKSAWDTDAPTDHDRPLNKRGRRDAVAVGDRIAKLEWSPRQVMSSDSARTRETWKRMRKSFEHDDIDVRFTRDLYHAGIGAVRDELARVPDEVKTVMVIGHNPGWEGVVDALSGEDVGMTTCNAALLSVETDSWAEAAMLDSCWKLHRVIRPKEL